MQKHKGVADPLEVVAGEISHESILLCLDEFMVRYNLRSLKYLLSTFVVIYLINYYLSG